MNREILFKGKRKDNGMWEYGNLSMRDETRRSKYYIGQNMLGYEVLPETIGQYTGLTDKNGRKIFEGDILKAMGVDGEQIAPVVFRKGFFVLDEKNAFIRLGVGAFRKRQLEVIGNIHDNPELVREVDEND